MKPEEPGPLDEELLAWLAASDEALAQGQAPPLPCEDRFSPELRAQLQHRLAGLRLVQQLRPRNSAAG